MNYTVFYSWQSDLDNKLNRNFIHDALEKATKAVSKIEEFSLDAVVDRDTSGILGSPSIVDSITGKIAKSDVFVCDISIINSESHGRKMPNPNVLFELGYASSILGWERIILVQNAAFGGPEALPFDLRGRRILQYRLDKTLENKTSAKELLKNHLIDTFKNALKYYSIDILGSKEKAIWWGIWGTKEKVKMRGAHLVITRVSSDAFFFDAFLYDGARTGEISGKAQILTPHSAYARLRSEHFGDCEVIFRRRLDNDNWCIELEESPACDCYHGMNATFSGTYYHQNNAVINWGYLDEIDMNEIGRITGKYLPVFLNNFQQIAGDQSNFGNELVVVTAGVKGMYTTMESIVVLDQTGKVWCACLDPEGENTVVRYFTNSPNDAKPEAISEWVSRFPEFDFFDNVLD